MEAAQFKNLIAIVELDIQVLVTGMIRSKKYFDNEVVELGGFICASYYHFSKKENIEMTFDEEINLINHVCEFYNKLILPSGIKKTDEDLIKNKYFELQDKDPSIIQAHIEKVAEVASKYMN